MPRKEPLNDYFFPNNVEIVYKPSATFNDEIICLYMEKYLPHHAEFVWIIDSAKTKVKNKAQELGINLIFIPP